MTDKPAIAWTYVGNGKAIFGVPKRDLTAEDFDNLSISLRREVTDGGFYTEVKPAEPEKSDEKAASAPDAAKGPVQPATPPVATIPTPASAPAPTAPASAAAPEASKEG